MLVLVLAGLLEGRGFDLLKLVNGSGLAYIPLYSPSRGKHLSDTLSQHDGASKHPVSSSDNADRVPLIVFQHCALCPRPVLMGFLAIGIYFHIARTGSQTEVGQVRHVSCRWYRVVANYIEEHTLHCKCIHYVFDYSSPQSSNWGDRLCHAGQPHVPTLSMVTTNTAANPKQDMQTYRFRRFLSHPWSSFCPWTQHL